jgi:hypothetical protein
MAAVDPRQLPSALLHEARKIPRPETCFKPQPQ